jgi:hypothetical protein
MLRTAYVFDDETHAFLHSGCALLIGSVEPGGRPRAGRGWGMRVLDGEPTTLRLLLDAEDEVTIANVAAGQPVAVTATSVRTLRSMQLKGRALGIEPLTPEDEEVAATYCRSFFADIVETDGTDPALPARMVPLGYVACTFEAFEVYDQTPGPGAGQPVQGSR